MSLSLVVTKKPLIHTIPIVHGQVIYCSDTREEFYDNLNNVRITTDKIIVCATEDVRIEDTRRDIDLFYVVLESAKFYIYSHLYRKFEEVTKIENIEVLLGDYLEFIPAIIYDKNGDYATFALSNTVVMQDGKTFQEYIDEGRLSDSGILMKTVFKNGRVVATEENQRIFNITFPISNYMSSGNNILIFIDGLLYDEIKYAISEDKIIIYDEFSGIPLGKTLLIIFIYNLIVNPSGTGMEIDGADIIPDSIDGSKLIDGTIPFAKLGYGILHGSKIEIGTLNSDRLIDNNLNGIKLLDDSVDSSKLIDNNLNGFKLLDDSVDSSKLIDNNLNGFKLLDNSVSVSKIKGPIVFTDISVGDCDHTTPGERPCNVEYARELGKFAGEINSTNGIDYIGNIPGVTSYYKDLTIIGKFNMANVVDNATIDINGLGKINVRKSGLPVTANSLEGYVMILYTSNDTFELVTSVVDFDSANIDARVLINNSIQSNKYMMNSINKSKISNQREYIKDIMIGVGDRTLISNNNNKLFNLSGKVLEIYNYNQEFNIKDPTSIPFINKISHTFTTDIKDFYVNSDGIILYTINTTSPYLSAYLIDQTTSKLTSMVVPSIDYPISKFNVFDSGALISLDTGDSTIIESVLLLRRDILNVNNLIKEDISSLGIEKKKSISCSISKDGNTMVISSLSSLNELTCPLSVFNKNLSTWREVHLSPNDNSFKTDINLMSGIGAYGNCQINNIGNFIFYYYEYNDILGNPIGKYFFFKLDIVNGTVLYFNISNKDEKFIFNNPEYNIIISNYMNSILVTDVTQPSGGSKPRDMYIRMIPNSNEESSSKYYINAESIDCGLDNINRIHSRYNNDYFITNNKDGKFHLYIYDSSLQEIINNTIVMGDSKKDGYFYEGDTVPSGTKRLNYNGYLYATRIYNAIYNDYAELFLKKNPDEILEAGDVIVKVPGEMKYTASYITRDCNVVGVVSENYGHLLGGTGNSDIDNKNYIAVGLAGVIPIKVKGVVFEGDLLISSEDGCAISLDENNYRPGIILGKALESNNSNRIKKINMLIMNA